MDGGTDLASSTQEAEEGGLLSKASLGYTWQKQR